MELRILKALDYRVNPNTHMFWINYYLKAWDEYIKDKYPNCMFRELSNVFINIIIGITCQVSTSHATI